MSKDVFEFTDKEIEEYQAQLDIGKHMLSTMNMDDFKGEARQTLLSLLVPSKYKNLTAVQMREIRTRRILDEIMQAILANCQKDSLNYETDLQDKEQLTEIVKILTDRGYNVNTLMNCGYVTIVVSW
jgi:hypothetical protein